MSTLSESFVKKDCTIKEAMKKIDSTEKKTVFVVKNSRRLVGVVNDGDIRRALLNGIDPEETVEKIMNTNPITDVETAKERIKITDTQYLMVPIINEENEIVDVTVVTKKDDTKLIENKNKGDRVLVIGGAGYLGSILCRKLLKKGYKVRVLDNLMYGDDGIRDLYKDANFEFIYGDMRDLQKLVSVVKDVNSVIHLAAIVGDPASALDPKQTIETNYFSSKMVSEVCKFFQINRFIFASTCSVYGASKDNSLLMEQSELNPVSLYAKMKLKSEKGILEMADENFKPTIFRMATLHGLSPRMRFDLVVNVLSAKAVYDHEITIHGGEQKRAFCHVEDAADAYIKCIESPIDKVGNQIFNIVSENSSIRHLGDVIHNLIPYARLKIEPVNDLRDYIVSSSWASSTMDLKYSKKIIDTIQNIADSKSKYSDWQDKKYSNIKYLRGE